MKYKIANYVIKVWLTTVIAGPILLVVIALLQHNVTKDPFAIAEFLVIILMGSICSLPSMALFYLACIFAIPNARNKIFLKGLLSVIGVLLVYVPFLIIDDFHPLLNIDQLSRLLFITYAPVIIAAIWLYKIKPVPPVVAA